MQLSFRLALCQTLLSAMLLTACYEEGPRLCPNGPSEPTPDTLIGARVDGRSVLVRDGSSRSIAILDSSDYLVIFGWRIEDTPPQIIDLRFYGFHGVGSYPIADLWGPGRAFAAYGCGYDNDWDGHVTYWPLPTGMAGDSAWVTEWDSVSGRLRGTFSFHSSDSEGGLVTISDGTFDARVMGP